MKKKVFHSWCTTGYEIRRLRFNRGFSVRPIVGGKYGASVVFKTLGEANAYARSL